MLLSNNLTYCNNLITSVCLWVCLLFPQLLSYQDLAIHTHPETLGHTNRHALQKVVSSKRNIYQLISEIKLQSL